MRKFLLGSIAVILSAGILAGCSGGGSGTGTTTTAAKGESTAAGTTQDSSGKVKLTFINGFTGGDGAYMRKITDGFNKSQDKYFVEELQEKDHYVKFETGEFDMVVIHGDLLATYVADETIQPVDKIYEQSGVKLTDFHEAGQKLVQFDGVPYAFPLDIHPLTMFYNKKLTQEGPKNYAEIVKLKDTLPENVYPMGIPGSGLVEWYMMFLAAQNNVTIVEGDAYKFDTDEFAQVLLDLNKMIYKDQVSPSGLGLDGEFNTFMTDAPSATAAQTAIALTGPWFYSAAKEKYGDDLGIGAIPVIGKQAATYGNAHTIAVSSKVTDETKIAGISEFVTYLYTTENLINWADSGQAPLYVPVMDYIKEHQSEYPLAYVNQQQFDSVKMAPQVYNVREQSRYLNENVYALVVSTPDLTKEQLMPELEKATSFAKEASEQ